MAALDDSHEIYVRLTEFLSNFRAQYAEDGAGGADLERMLGDCTEVLHELLDYVDRCLGSRPGGESDMALGAASIDDTIAEAGALQTTPLDASAASDEVALRADGERGAASGSSDAAAAASTGDGQLALPRLLDLIPEALQAAELILREERYANAVRESPEAISRILSMLERLRNPESLRLGMTLLSRLATSSRARREIGRRQGFRTLLRLVMRRDDTLTREVLRTCTTLLSAASDADDTSAGANADAAAAAA